MNIAIIDDSELISQMISKSVKPYGYIPQVIKSKNVKNGDFVSSKFKMLVINSNLLNRSQLDLIAEIRRINKEIAILGVVKSKNANDKICIYESGADDVINFPFLIKEFLIRIENLMSRKGTRKDKIYTLDKIFINTGEKSVKYDDEEIDLRRKEYSILEYLARNQGRTVSRNELLDNIWDYTKITESNTIDVHISNIRKKLSNNKIIKTIHGFGYRIDKKKA